MRYVYFLFTFVFCPFRWRTTILILVLRETRQLSPHKHAFAHSHIQYTKDEKQ